MSELDGTYDVTESHSDESHSTVVKAYFRDVVKSTVIVAGGNVHYTTIVQGREITLPTPEELAAHRAAVADHYAKWDDPRYIQEEGEFLPLFASPYDEVEGPGRERTDLLDAIREAHRIIVLGEPGMGKTTALERLMLEYARRDDGPLPVFVPLLYYTGDLMASVRTELNRHAAFHLPDEAHTCAFLQGVPCVLMFDGLNEVSGRLREKVAGDIRGVMNDYPCQRYAVSSRSQDELWPSLRGEDEDMPAVVIREIGDEQVRDYLCGHLGAEAGQALYDRLDERMRGLAHNPLLLWMIKEARTDEAGALPDNRGRLFDHFVTQILKREVRLKEWATSVPAEVKRECLAELAYEMFTSERESRLFVASAQADMVLAGYLEKRPGTRYEARQVLEEAKRNGLLTGEENVRFMHQSVQEFFAACRLREQAVVERAWGPWERGLRGVQAALGCDRRLAARARNDWWAETFILLAGIAEDPSWLVRQVARENAWLAYWCLLEGQEVDEEARLAVERATTEALSSPRHAVRLRAVQALSGLANPRTVEPLITALGDEDEGVAGVAQRALVRLGDASVDDLIAALEDDSQRIRRWAAEVLGQIRDARASGPLIAVLDDKDEGVVEIVHQALVQLGDAAMNALIATLEDNSQQIHTRLEVVEVLMQIGSPRAIEPLIAVLKDKGDDKRLRRTVVHALYKLRWAPSFDYRPKALVVIDGEVWQEFLQELLTREGWQVSVVSTWEEAIWRLNQPDIFHLAIVDVPRLPEEETASRTSLETLLDLLNDRIGKLPFEEEPFVVVLGFARLSPTTMKILFKARVSDFIQGEDLVPDPGETVPYKFLERLPNLKIARIAIWGEVD